MSFTGWSDRAYEVMLDLQGDPGPAELEEHRDAVERYVRQPLQQLCDALNETDEFGTFWPGGMSDRPWGWQHQNITWWIARRIKITFTFDVDGFALGGGSGSPAPDQVQLYRKLVDEEGAGTELADIVRRLERAGFDLLGSKLQRLPSEFRKDHPRADLLRRRGIYAEKPIETTDLRKIRKDLRELHALTTWYTDYIAPAGWEKP